MLRWEDNRKCDIIAKIVTKNGSVCFYNASRPRPKIKTNSESCNAALAVEENTIDSKSTKVVKVLLLDFDS